MKFETPWIQFLADVFGLLSSRNFATMATWRKDFSSLVSPEKSRPDGLPRTQALLGILCGNRGEGGHGKCVWLFTASLPLCLCVINALPWSSRRDYRRKSQEAPWCEAAWWTLLSNPSLRRLAALIVSLLIVPLPILISVLWLEHHRHLYP